MIAPSAAAADRVASRPPGFEVCVQPDRDVIYVKPVGELDLATAPQLRDELNELVAAGFKQIVIDLRALLFIDCAGVGLLVALNADAPRRGWSLSLIQGRACVRRVFEITVTLDILPFTAPLATRRRPPWQATHPPAHHERPPVTPRAAIAETSDRGANGHPVLAHRSARHATLRHGRGGGPATPPDGSQSHHVLQSTPPAYSSSTPRAANDDHIDQADHNHRTGAMKHASNHPQTTRGDPL
jgi:anti-sigma B factor antagonist